MSLRSQLRAQDGFTIQELMVVLIVGSLLVTFSFTVFRFTSNRFFSWHSRTELESEVSRVLQLIASDVTHSKQIVDLTDSSLMLVLTTSNLVRYEIHGNRVYRNRAVVGSESIDFVLHLDPITLSSSDRYPKGVGIRVDGRSRKLTVSAKTKAMILLSAREDFLSTRR